MECQQALPLSLSVCLSACMSVIMVRSLKEGELSGTLKPNVKFYRLYKAYANSEITTSAELQAWIKVANKHILDDLSEAVREDFIDIRAILYQRKKIYIYYQRMFQTLDVLRAIFWA